MAGGNQVGEISGQVTGDANQLTGESITSLMNRNKQLGLGATGATPSGATTGTTPGVPGSGTTPTTPGDFGAGPTGFQMDEGALPSLTGGIPNMFQAALGEAQFQDLGQTAAAAAGSANAKGQTFSGIGQLGGLLGGI
ncbi:MAG TPA: hypothetical protein VGJ20_20490 [Xanthobacteraceae bacterium]|jgi:hypothetical protein